MITVCTPTYNRAHLLPDLYNSLQKQTCKDFEWIVVDDGSTDNTENLVDGWLHNESFAVRYCKKPNGGKPSAINCGLDMARGEYFWIVDSDDTVTPQAVESCIRWIETLPQNKKFAGVGGLRGDKNGGIIGTTFDGEFVDATTLERAKHNICGDKSEVFLTSLLRQFPFPSFDGEKFVPEALIWNRIAQAGYKIRWFNEIIHITEYLEDGLTKNTDRLLINNWKGYSLYVRELLKSSAPLKDKILIGGAYCLRGVKKICRR